MRSFMHSDRRTVLEVPWGAYLRTISKGGSLGASCARLCLDLGGETVSKTNKELDRRLRIKLIDKFAFDTYKQAIETCSTMFMHGTQTHVVDTKGGEWKNCGDGCHIRMKHLGADK